MNQITNIVYHVVNSSDEVVLTFDSYQEAVEFIGEDEDNLCIEREIINEEPWGAP